MVVLVIDTAVAVVVEEQQVLVAMIKAQCSIRVYLVDDIGLEIHGESREATGDSIRVCDVRPANDGWHRPQ